MADIRQTPFGRLLCWLGVHLLVEGGRRDMQGMAERGSTWGGCVRCQRTYQWDS